MDVLSTLTPREEKVLRLRFGLDDGRARTLEEVGKEFNVTRERIRQIEAKALRKLRHPSRSKKLKDYLNKICHKINFSAYILKSIDFNRHRECDYGERGYLTAKAAKRL